MIILPMATNEKNANVRVSFEKEKLTTQENCLLAINKDTYLGDFLVNHTYYFGNDLSNEERDFLEKQLKRNPEILTDFIRQYMNTREDHIYVLSKNYQEKDFYTKYCVPLPPKKGILALDKIYGKLLNDLRLDVKGKEEDHFLSLSSLHLQDVMMQDTEKSLKDIVDILEYLQELQFETLDENYEERIQKAIKSRPKKFPQIYQQMALENSVIYQQIYKLHQHIFETNPSWPNFEEQQKVYTKKIDNDKNEKKASL